MQGRKMPRGTCAVVGVVKVSLEVDAHPGGGHVAFDNILLIL